MIKRMHAPLEVTLISVRYAAYPRSLHHAEVCWLNVAWTLLTPSCGAGPSTSCRCPPQMSKNEYSATFERINCDWHGRCVLQARGQTPKSGAGLEGRSFVRRDGHRWVMGGTGDTHLAASGGQRASCQLGIWRAISVVNSFSDERSVGARCR